MGGAKRVSQKQLRAASDEHFRLPGRMGWYVEVWSLRECMGPLVDRKKASSCVSVHDLQNSKKRAQALHGGAKRVFAKSVARKAR